MPGEMAAVPLPQILLFTRPGCHLCDDTRLALEGLLEDRAALGQAIATVHEIDITADPDIERRNFDVIPVVELGGRRVALPVSPAKSPRVLPQASASATDPT